MFTHKGVVAALKLLCTNTKLHLIYEGTWEGYKDISLNWPTTWNQDMANNRTICYMEDANPSSTSTNTATMRNKNIFYYADLEAESDPVTISAIQVLKSDSTVLYEEELDTPIVLQPNERPRFSVGQFQFTLTFTEADNFSG